MEPLVLSFTTFLKICAASPRGKIGELRSFLAPGGYDFYKNLRKLARATSLGEISGDDARAKIASIKRSSERSHTLEAFEKFHAWFVGQDVAWKEPPQTVFVSKSGELKIRLRPEIAFESDGVVRAFCFWNLMKPKLTTELSGLGLTLVREAFSSKLPNAEFAVFDLRLNRFLDQSVISMASALQLQRQIEIVELIWDELHNPAITVEETVEHVATLRLPPAPPPS